MWTRCWSQAELQVVPRRRAVQEIRRRGTDRRRGWSVSTTGRKQPPPPPQRPARPRPARTAASRARRWERTEASPGLSRSPPWRTCKQSVAPSSIPTENCTQWGPIPRHWGYVSTLTPAWRRWRTTTRRTNLQVTASSALRNVTFVILHLARCWDLCSKYLWSIFCYFQCYSREPNTTRAPSTAWPGVLEETLSPPAAMIKLSNWWTSTPGIQSARQICQSSSYHWSQGL